MENKFPILAGSKIVGTATVIRRGLYYLFHCTCHFTEPNPYRITVTRGDTKTDLGICVPMEGGFGIRTQVPVKRLGEGNFCFTLAGYEEDSFVSIEPGKPFPYISQLKNARLAVRNGKTGILISNAYNSISNPTGQWSEPSTSE